MSSAGESTELQAISPDRVSARLGRLFQTTLWRARPCSAVSGPLYPSRCHLESSYSLGHRIRSSVPVERLCESQQEAHDDPHRRRIPSPIPTACLAERVSAHSILRVVGQSETSKAASPLSPSSQSAGTGAQCSRPTGSSEVSEVPGDDAHS